MKAEQEVYRQKDTLDKGLNVYQKWNKVTLVAGGGVVIFGLATANPLLVGAGATSMAIDGAQMYGVNKFKDWREKRRQEKVMREQLPTTAKSEVSIWQKVKDQIFPRKGIIYQRAPA